MTNDYQLINNEKQQQFEFDIDGYTPLIEYVNRDENIFLTHTEVPAAIEGKGVGSQLVEKTLLYIKNKNKHVVPLCPFVSAYIKKHPKWVGLVARN